MSTGMKFAVPKLGLEAMRNYYPRSFLRLLLLAFGAVALPLVFAFVNAALLVERLSDQSQTAVGQAAQAARGSRLLMEQATTLERVVRQYLVLEDPALLNDYERVRKRFKTTTSELSLLPLDEAQLYELNRTIDKEQELYTDMRRGGQRAAEKRSLIGGYADLSDMARRVLDVSNTLTDREVERLRGTATHAQGMLWWHLLATVPLGILICLGVTFFIARPIRQLDHAIRRLGGGEFTGDIHINGPADLYQLGGRLEWLRQRLLELEEQKQIFLRHVSHELKTPLTSLREGSELLADRTAGPLTPEQERIVSILREKSIQLQGMIDELLNYQQAQQSIAQLKVDSVRVDEVVRKVLADHHLAISSRNVRAQVRLEPLTVKADSEKLRVVIDNLVSNAIKYSPEGGAILLELRKHNDEVELEVTDAGPGIPVEDRERIFDWFYRGKHGRAGRVRGSGLGLAIAREFVHAHRGNIEVADAGPGAHFRVILPMEPFGSRT
jgi:two-component system sensor histidine kinase GlrK